MNEIDQLREAIVLTWLREAEHTGRPAEPVPGRLSRRLVADRLAEFDRFGQLRITERGLHHLQALERRGAIA